MEVNPGSSFGQHISVLSRMARTFFQRELKTLGIGPGQQAYLLVLSPGETVRQEELSRRLHVDKANVARAVCALAGKGFLTRSADRDDRRASLVSLTVEGQQAREEVERISSHWIELISRGIDPEEWNQASAVLCRIADNAVRFSGYSET